MEELLISVVMPAYNCERYLDPAVESVLAQSYGAWELLLLDDCSTDGTWERIQELSQRDPRIRAVQNQRNLGVGATRNLGVSLAQGDWIAFLDSDDLWRPDKLEKQLALLRDEPQARLLFTASGFITEEGEPLSYILHVPQRIARRQLLRQNLLSCSSVMVRRELLLQYPFPAKSMMHEDFAVWLQILAEEPFAYGVDEPLLIYRRSGSSKSANKLKAARMNWNTYRWLGLGLPGSLYYMAWYAAKSLKKYRNL